MKIVLLAWLGGSLFIVLLIVLQALAHWLHRLAAEKILRRAKSPEM